jgi:hypothetical protein
VQQQKREEIPHLVNTGGAVAATFVRDDDNLSIKLCTLYWPFVVF